MSNMWQLIHPQVLIFGKQNTNPIDIDATTLDIDASGALTLDSDTSISIGNKDDKPIDIDASL